MSPFIELKHDFSKYSAETQPFKVYLVRETSSKWTVLLGLLFMVVRVGSELTYFGIYIMLNCENGWELRVVGFEISTLDGHFPRDGCPDLDFTPYTSWCTLIPFLCSFFLLFSFLPRLQSRQAALCHDLLLCSASINQLLWHISWSWSQVKSSLPKDPDVNHTIAWKQDDFWLEHGFLFFFLSNITLFFFYLPFPLEY